MQSVPDEIRPFRDVKKMRGEADRRKEEKEEEEQKVGCE